MELFGSWIKPEWMNAILTWCEVYKEDTFIFLTKQPQNLNKYEFPSNCEVGVSCIDDKMFTHSFVPQFKNLKVKTKIISFEPLQSWDMSVDDTAWTLKELGIGLVIIGQQTPANSQTKPSVEAIRTIVESADKVGAKVFLKNNLNDLFTIGDMWALDDKNNLRQELPNE